MTRPCKACEGTGYSALLCSRAPRCMCMDHPCEACAGSGQVSERIPAADAVADAETLRFALQDAGLGLALFYRADAFNAEPPHETRVCARAAFRAVPGLRG